MVFGLDDAAFAALGSGALQAGTGVLGGILGSSGQSAANAQAQSLFNQQQTMNWSMLQEQERYNTQMSSTAYQRAMADMKTAGLNPILAGNIGGAQSPGISPMTASPPSIGNAGAALGEGIKAAGSAVQTAANTRAMVQQGNKAESEVELNKTTGELNKKVTDKAVQDTATSAANQRAADASARKYDADAVNAGISSGILVHQQRSAKAEADLKELETQASQKYGPGGWGHILNTLDRFAHTANDGASAREQQRRDEYKKLGLGNFNPPTPSETPLTIDMKRR